MKKIIALILAVMMLCSFMACGKKQEEPEAPVVSGEEVSVVDEVSPADNTAPVANPDDELKAILVGTWEYINDPPIPELTDFVVNVVFQPDGSYVFYGYENTMYGKYEVKDSQIFLIFEWGIGEGMRYEAADYPDENKSATYDAETELLTMKPERNLYDIVWTFKKVS